MNVIIMLLIYMAICKCKRYNCILGGEWEGKTNWSGHLLYNTCRYYLAGQHFYILCNVVLWETGLPVFITCKL